MGDYYSRRGVEPVELSDDELDSLSGGIPLFEDTSGGSGADYSTSRLVERAVPPLPLLQERPTEDPYAWF